jgi:transposase
MRRGGAPSVPSLDEGRIPVEVIELPSPETQGLSPGQFEIIGKKISYRLAQRPGSFFLLKYIRPVVKRRDTEVLSRPPVPGDVVEGCRADASFIAGVLIEKFAYDFPLYCQYQRLLDFGIPLSRPCLKRMTRQAVELLEPIYQAQLESIRVGRIKAVDETPIKVGPIGRSRAKIGYFWPVYGGQEEVCFPVFPTGAVENVREVLGGGHALDGVLWTEGHAAYQSYATKVGLAHAQSWALCRTTFLEAQSYDPEGAREALQQIAALYAIEGEIRERGLEGEAKRLHRLTHSKPRVDAFFDWIRRRVGRRELLLSGTYVQALEAVRRRRPGLEIFLTDPDVPMEAQSLEGAAATLPAGQKSWNFCCTELSAKHAGIAQSLIVTCRLHTVDLHTYLADVLQRVGQHPASRVEQLTPRLWKQYFADNPLRSDLRASGAPPRGVME